jgi:hypothetical protein
MAQCELVHLGSTLPSGPFTQDVIATATGLSGLAAGLAGAVITIAVAILVDRFSYGPAFLIEGLLPLFATARLFQLDPSKKVTRRHLLLRMQIEPENAARERRFTTQGEHPSMCELCG